MSLLPEEFQQTMKQKLGSEFPEFEATLRGPSPTSIRMNPAKATAVSSDHPVPWASHAKYLAVRPAFTFDPLFHAGTYYVQEASSMFLEQAVKQTVDLSLPLNVLDLCAAPGGKSTHLLSLLSGQSLLVSNEVIRSRASILAENIQKWGRVNSVVTNNDPEDFQGLSGFFDVMVIDAPCSGEGLFRKDPDAASEWSSQNVALCASRQKRIIADAWPALKENGILIYCTCTYNDAENENNLQWLAQNHEVEFLSLTTNKVWGIDEVREGNVTGYRFYPHRLNGEGFFISVIRKKETQQTARSKTKTHLTTPPKRVTDVLRTWIAPETDPYFFQHNDTVSFFPAAKLQEANALKEHLRIVGAGTALAAVKHDKLIPEHAAAMSAHLLPGSFPAVALDRERAIAYLRREPFQLPELERGYHLITFENTALGWINNIGNRYNNLYPQEWRIRMAPR